MAERLRGGPLLEAVLFGMVRSAIQAIRKQRAYHTVKAKVGCSGHMDDVCTSADLAAQAVYVRIVGELFPDYGVIAEEADMRIECNPGLDADIYFTIDPLDGTKAFIRSQSYGIGTMVALVRGDDVIASCIGNVMTQELYSQPPEDSKAWRIDYANIRQRLIPDLERPLSRQYALIRDRPETHSTLVKRMLEIPANGGLCKNYQTVDGSIGLSMARLWNGEVGLAIQPSSSETPWDATPVIGINKRLDIVQLQQKDDGYFISVPYRLTKIVTQQPETIYVHRENLEQLMRWQEKTFERLR